MRFLNRKSDQLTPGSERLAARIAGRIIGWQRSTADKINRQINRYSKAGQRKLLMGFCIAWIAVIGFNLFHARKTTTIHSVKANYLPAHIGQPSDIPEPTNRPNPKIDSLTIKK